MEEGRKENPRKLNPESQAYYYFLNPSKNDSSSTLPVDFTLKGRILPTCNKDTRKKTPMSGKGFIKPRGIRFRKDICMPFFGSHV